MSARAAATLLAGLAFVGIVGIGLLGADRPPPPGFLLVVLLAAGFASGVRLLVPRLLRQPPGRSLLLAGAFGTACCVAFWALGLIGTAWSPWLLLGLVVMAVLGAAGGAVVMGVARGLTRGRSPS